MNEECLLSNIRDQHKKVNKNKIPINPLRPKNLELLSTSILTDFATPNHFNALSAEDPHAIKSVVEKSPPVLIRNINEYVKYILFINLLQKHGKMSSLK